MKLTLLDHLQVRKFPQRLPPMHSNLVNVSQEVESTKGFSTENHYHRTTAEIGYTSVDPDETPIEYIRERGTQSIMREVYGPVINELLTLTKELHELGLSSQDKPLKRIWEMIDTLEGKR